MEEKIKELLESLRIHLQNDGGDLELVKIEGTTVFLKLKGACGGCRARAAFYAEGDYMAEEPWCLYHGGARKNE